MQILKKVFFSALFITVAVSDFSHAQDFQRPEPVSVQGRHMSGFGTEGIVKVRYTVTSDGTVDDIQIFDYVSNQFLNNMLRDSVSDWTFNPGTVDGEPADFYNQEWLFALRVDPNAPAEPPPGSDAPVAESAADAESSETAIASPANAGEQLPLALSQEIKDYVVEIYELIAVQDIDEAQKQVNRLMRRDFITVFDYGLAHELQANILMTNNEVFEALEAVTLATMTYAGPRGDVRYFLTDDALEVALKRKLLLSMSVGQNQLAWDTYVELTNKFDIPEEDRIHEQAQQVKALLDSPEPLQLITKIIDDQWTYKPTRRIFTVTNIDGRLSEIEARCERRNLELEYQENVDWTLPAALGECALDFKGRDGTQFVVYEFSE